MKKVLLASVAAASLVASGSAFAADLPSRHIEPVAPVVMAPIFTWTGFYAGVNAGYAWNNKKEKASWNGVAFHYNEKNKQGGFTGGGQIGYNYQFGQFVAGVEADINYADLKGKKGGSYNFTYVPGTNYFGASSTGIEWFGTVRARLGVAFDRALVYGTGGFAYGGGGDGHGFIYNGYFYDNKKNTRTGWTLGGGVEYAITNNITARLEGLYVNLGKQNRNHYTLASGDYSKRKDTAFGVVRAGLNYKFDSF